MTSLLKFNDTIIRDEGKFLNLTDMWRAAGGDRDSQPFEWLRQSDTLRFMDHLLSQPAVIDDIKNMQKSPNRSIPGSGNAEKNGGLVLTLKGGADRGGMTLAHWHLAMAYAKYLSPAFHVWCNEVVRAHMEGTLATGDTVPRAVVDQLLARLADLDGMAAMLVALREEVALLRLTRPAPGLLGAPRAESLVKRKVRDLARLHHRITGDDYRSVRALMESDLRFAVSFFGAWDTLAEDRLPDVLRHLAGVERVLLRRHLRLVRRGPGLAATRPGQLPLPMPLAKAK